MTETVNFIRTQIRPLASEFIIRLDRDLTDPSHFQEEIATIEAAGESDLIHIKINSGGGQINTALAIINAMNKSPAFTRCEVVGEACSAATMVFLNGDEKIINPLSSFMIHTASYGYGGKENNVRQYVEHQTKAVGDLLHKTYKGFLTEDEIQSVIDGKDFWFSAEEVEERLGRVVEIQEQEVIEKMKEEYTPDVYAQQVLSDIVDDCERLGLDCKDIISLMKVYYEDIVEPVTEDSTEPFFDGEVYPYPLEVKNVITGVPTSEFEQVVDWPDAIVLPDDTDSGVYSLIINDGFIFSATLVDNEYIVDKALVFTTFTEVMDDLGLVNLKGYAKTLGVKFSHNIGLEKLADRMDEAVERILSENK